MCTCCTVFKLWYDHAGNVAPHDIVLSAPRTYSGTTVPVTVGTLSALDWNTGQTASFSVVGGTHAALFSIVAGTQLRVTSTPPSNTWLQVQIQATDNGTPALSFRKTMLIVDGAWWLVGFSFPAVI